MVSARRYRAAANQHVFQWFIPRDDKYIRREVNLDRLNFDTTWGKPNKIRSRKSRNCFAVSYTSILHYYDVKCSGNFGALCIRKEGEKMWLRFRVDLYFKKALF